ncbi:hypothetical protein M8818_005156 [Zalaria obscura]|uniref:Uncharacterized protein n=1 Tax=Zalaria obscura TaxID=2024903 RepID=A0ACC3SBE7_9PEZI
MSQRFLNPPSGASSSAPSEAWNPLLKCDNSSALPTVSAKLSSRHRQIQQIARGSPRMSLPYSTHGSCQCPSDGAMWTPTANTER